MTRLITTLATLALVLAASTAFGQANGVVPVQGVLVDAAGAGLDGTFELTLTLYDDAAGTSMLATESQQVLIDGGYFTVHFGATGPLDPALFRDNASLWLGVAVDTDPEMTPLVEIGTAPWAGYSEYAGEADDASMLGGVAAGDYRLSTDTVDWSLVTGAPADADTLAGLTCIDGQIAQWDAAAIAWECVTAATTTETDPVFAASDAAGITGTDTGNWNTAFGYGDHAAAGYLTTESDPSFAASEAASITSTDTGNWNVAFGYGDHAAAGYLTTESDPGFAASVAAAIATTDVANWNAAFGYGDHATAGYLTGESDPALAAFLASGGTISATTTVSGASQDLVVSNTTETEAGLLLNDFDAPANQFGAIYYDSAGNDLNIYINDLTAPAASIDPSGTVTATAFVGDGSGLTGISGTGAETDPVFGTFLSGGGVVSGDVTVSTAANAQIGIDSGGTGVEWALRASGEDFVIVEPDDLGQTYLTIEDGGDIIFDAGGNSSVDFTIGSTGTVTAVAFVGDGSGLTGITGTGAETDPVFGGSAASGISAANIAAWDASYPSTGGILAGNLEVSPAGGAARVDFDNGGGDTSNEWAWVGTENLTLTEPEEGDKVYMTVNDDSTIVFTPGGFSGAVTLGTNGSVTATSFTGDGSGLTNVTASFTEADPVWTGFQGAGGAIAGNLQLAPATGTTAELGLNMGDSGIEFAWRVVGDDIVLLEPEDGDKIYMTVNDDGSMIFTPGGGTAITMNTDGSLRSQCPSGTNELAGTCVENFGGGVNAAAAWQTAALDCATRGMELASMAALTLCDLTEPAGASCTAATDNAGVTLWTSDHSGSSNPFDYLSYNGGNVIAGQQTSVSNQYLCMTRAYHN